MAEIGPNASNFFEAFAAQAGLRKYDYRTISGILALAKRYGHETVDAACSRAQYYDSFSYTIVRKICEKGLSSLPVYENETYVNEQPNEFARDLKEYVSLSELGVLQ